MRTARNEQDLWKLTSGCSFRMISIVVIISCSRSIVFVAAVEIDMTYIEYENGDNML